MRKKIYPKNRNCPECGKKLKAYRMSCIKNSKCQSCATKELNKIYKNSGWKKKISKYININPPYIKKCPECQDDMIYNNKYTYIYSVEHDKKCQTCANIGKNVGIKRTDEVKNKLSNAQIKRFKNPKERERYSTMQLGKKLSMEHKRNISEGNKGKIRSNENKKQYRISAIKRIEKNKLDGNQLVPNFNPNACKIIDEYGKKTGYNFQHAMNGGEFHIKELGYWVDGYDRNKNVVVECYEKRHFKDGKLKIKDINRQTEIINHLNCKFIVYDFRIGEFIYVK